MLSIGNVENLNGEICQHRDNIIINAKESLFWVQKMSWYSHKKMHLYDRTLQLVIIFTIKTQFCQNSLQVLFSFMWTFYEPYCKPKLSLGFPDQWSWSLCGKVLIVPAVLVICLRVRGRVNPTKVATVSLSVFDLNSLTKTFIDAAEDKRCW